MVTWQPCRSNQRSRDGWSAPIHLAADQCARCPPDGNTDPAAVAPRQGSPQSSPHETADHTAFNAAVGVRVADPRAMAIVVIVAIPVGALPIGSLPLLSTPSVPSPVAALPVVSSPLVVVPVGAAPIGLSPMAVACWLVRRGDGRPHHGAFDGAFHWAVVTHLVACEGVSQGWCGRRGH